MDKSKNKYLVWGTYFIQLVIGAMFIMAAIMNLLQNEKTVQESEKFGYTAEMVPYLGIVLLISTLLYLLPKTNIVGAILLSAWLGGAVATHAIHKDPLAAIFTPVIFGIFVWLPLLLRDSTLKTIFPIRR